VEQTWLESSDESEMLLSAGARESAMASAAVPKKAATAAIRHPIWPYRVIAVPIWRRWSFSPRERALIL
jgi:hypothetical protein